MLNITVHSLPISNIIEPSMHMDWTPFQRSTDQKLLRVVSYYEALVSKLGAIFQFLIWTLTN